MKIAVEIDRVFRFPLNITERCVIKDTVEAATADEVVLSGLRPRVISEMQRIANKQSGLRRSLARKMVAKSVKEFDRMSALEFCNAIIALFNEYYGENKPPVSSVDSFFSLGEQEGYIKVLERT